MSEPEFVVVFPLFPAITQLDFTGPFEVFQRVPNARCVLASTSGGELNVGQNMTLSDLSKLSDVPRCDLLCVPGGYGVVRAARDQALLAELRRLANSARYITSVCTGSLLLGAAGLLRGKRAACHWAWRERLSQYEAIVDPGRVVRDGNLITGGGVTAGIDMALTVSAELAGRTFAEGLQLALEYAPEPPFDSGRPESARPELVEAVRERVRLQLQAT